MRVLKQIRLGDCGKVLSGYAFKSEDFTTEGVAVIKIANIKNGAVTLDPEFTEYLPESIGGTVHERFRVKRGDILISLTGSHMTQPNSVVGRVAQYKESFNSWLNQRAGKVIITAKSELDTIISTISCLQMERGKRLPCWLMVRPTKPMSLRRILRG